MLYLDELSLLQPGEIGAANARLPYRNNRVAWHGRSVYDRSICAGVPSQLAFDLASEHTNFICRAGFTDAVSHLNLRADFCVMGDGRVLTIARDVASECEPVLLCADVRGVSRLELIVTSREDDYGAATWFDTQLDTNAFVHETTTIQDCLERVEIVVPSIRIKAKQCIATVVSPGFTEMLEEMLASLRANGNCRDTAVVVYAVDPDEECYRVAARYEAHLIHCRSLVPRSGLIKVAVYTAARVVDAEQYLCIDADTLILKDLAPLFDELSSHSESTVLVAEDNFVKGAGSTLIESLCGFYMGEPADIGYLLGGCERDEAEYGLIVNGGVMAGGRQAILELESRVRGMMPMAAVWLARMPHHVAREQFLFNLAFANMKSGVKMDAAWNVLVGLHCVARRATDGGTGASYDGRVANILHFAGSGRGQWNAWRGLFSGER